MPTGQLRITAFINVVNLQLFAGDIDAFQDEVDGNTIRRDPKKYYELYTMDGRVQDVSWDDLLKDYGCSCGEYAMEADAFARFRTLAEEHSVSFEAEPYAGDDSLMVVQIGREFITLQPD